MGSPLRPRYLRPLGLDEAVAALAVDGCTVLAGGTDLYPAELGSAPALAGDDPVLDITALSGLRGIEESDAFWRLGALTTWSDLLKAPLPPGFNALKQAAREVGGVQIQNAGTIAGNLCNASPAADGVPPLLALDAVVELISRAGQRRLALDDFILGNRKTARRPDELVTAILVPKRMAGARARFEKLGARRYLVISIAMVATTLLLDATKRIAEARVAVGACAARARRLPAVEAVLKGAIFDEDLVARAAEASLEPLTPIDDLRGTAVYRRDAVRTLIRRSLEALLIEQGM